MMRFNKIYCLLFCLLGIANGLLAQYGGVRTDRPLQEIQDSLSAAIRSRNLRAQAQAWYEWAWATEARSGLNLQGFQYFRKSAEMYFAAGDSLTGQCALADLADRFVNIGDYAEALRLQSNALRYFRVTKNERLEAQLLTRMIRTYQQSNESTQERAFRKLFAEKNTHLQDQTLDLSLMVSDIEYALQSKNFALAVDQANAALQIAQQIGHQKFADRALFLLAAGLAGLGKSNVALNRLHEATQRPLWHRDPWERRRLLQAYAEAYKQLDSLPKAFAFMQQYAYLGDSLRQWSVENTMRVAAVEYQTDRKTKELAALAGENTIIQQNNRLQRTRIWLLATLLFGGAVGVYYMYRNYQRRLHDEKLIAKQQTEINTQRIRELEDRNKIENMQSMLEGQESERKRIAYDLHDSLGGILATSKLQVEQLRTKFPKMANDGQLLKLRELLNATVQEVRQISRDLQPNLKFGLVKALRDLVGLMQTDGPPEISFHAVGNFDCLDKSTMLHCYRIVQELLQNSLKYAQATEILVQITANDGQITLLVEDDGRGFDVEAAQRGMGLNNIEHRVQFLKGELSVHSSPEHGTSTMVTVQVEPCSER